MTLARPDAVLVPSVALESTAYTPARTLAGTFLVMVTVPVCPGLRVKEVVEKEVDQPDGWLEARLKVPAEHAAESLFITIML